ncbi:MAG: discoidin domain-containing protein, partial [Candidatus Aminicenantes bacterium]|nr:discoidin domain-containing protein [Candidatus Aminicenantes bacterium]
TKAHIRLSPGGRTFSRAFLDGKDLSGLIEGREVSVKFPGKPLQKAWFRRLGKLDPCPVPADSEALYEATCFAGDSNALEVRSLLRSGPTRIPQVEKARESFFEQPMFVNRGIWDKNLFDGSLETFFIARLEGRALRIDFGQPIFLDELIIKMRSKYEHDINPALHRFTEDNVAEVSRDLKTWTPVGHWEGKGTIAVAKIPTDTPIRFVRIHGAPRRIAEVEGYYKGVKLDRTSWRASNLFFSYSQKPAQQAWSSSFMLDEIPKGGYLAVALNGDHGNEGAYAAVRADGRPVGAPDRAVSYPSNTWEYYNTERKSNYTYFVPLEEDWIKTKIEVVVLVLEGGKNEIQPEVYITAYPIPFEAKELVLFD